ncbi:MAG: 3-dehydroquinate synthase [Kiloniellales bacterium]
MLETLSAGAPSETAVQTLRVDLGARGYDILVGANLFDRLAEELASMTRGSKVFIVTEKRVAAHHLGALQSCLAGHGILAESLILPPGEGSKSFDQLERLCRDLIGRGLERSDLLLALGGGVIGDLVGFAAAILLRGIGFVQIPTTLLAQVDSSVGGKTAIDVPEGKNLIGAFHQPRLVVCDTALLSSLPDRDMRAGYGEVVKYGFLGDRAFFEWLEDNGGAVLDRQPAALREAVVRSCAAKAAIVARDEQEAGDRALLNLGHTFGHALEAAVGYDERLLHGEGVSLGMCLAFDLSMRLGLCKGEEAARARAHLQRLGLPTKASFLEGVPLNAQGLVQLMQRDKKVEAGRITFILVRAIGDAFVARDVDPGDVVGQLEDWLAGGSP